MEVSFFKLSFSIPKLKFFPSLNILKIYFCYNEKVDFSLIGLAAYILYLPCLFILIIVAAKRFNHFFVSRHLLSTLAETISPSFKIISGLIVLFSLLRMNMAFQLAKFLPRLALTRIGLLFLYLSCLGSFLAALYPRDKFRQIHGIFGTLLLIGALGSFTFLIYPIYLSKQIPNLILFLNFIIIGFVILMLSADFISFNRLDGFISKNRAYWQWILLTLIIVWDFILSFIILFHLSENWTFLSNF